MKKFEFKVKLGGHSTAMCFMRPPFNVVEVFGTKARVPVRGTINGFPFRSSLSNMGQSNMGEGHCMPVNKTLREGGKCKAGDIVEIVMERDDEKRVVAPPPLLKKELAKSKTAQANWDKMSFTNKKEIARSITEVKQEETRARRLAKAMDILRSGRKWTG
jgi:hypothetical protein